MVFDRRPGRRSTVARALNAGPPLRQATSLGYYAAGVAIPAAGEPVEWSANLRANLPDYVMRQLHEAAHRERRTLMSVLLNVLSAHRDTHGRPPFCIRDEDLVDDRRKAPQRDR